MPKREILSPDGRSSFWLDDAAREPNVIVFVHGYDGNAKETWQRFPELIKEQGQGFERFEVGLIDYPTRGIASSKTVELLAKRLLTFIDTYTDANNYIFIIAHSLGGLVARRFLVETFEQPDGRRIFLKVRQVHFIGVPHLGVAYTSFLGRLPRINSLVSDIRDNSPSLLSN
jgi:triacylglycerol esterase/lipase EstA (alpha/beta hydrolase family)